MLITPFAVMAKNKPTHTTYWTLYVSLPLFFFFLFSVTFHKLSFITLSKQDTEKAVTSHWLDGKEVAPKIDAQARDQKIPYLGLKGCDMAYCFSDSLLLISKQHPGLLNRRYWHFIMESRHQPGTNLLASSKSILLHISLGRNSLNQLNIRTTS